jgi:hypothetical protein
MGVVAPSSPDHACHFAAAAYVSNISLQYERLPKRTLHPENEMMKCPDWYLA